MPLLNLKEAANYLRIAPSYLRKLVQSRRVPYSKPTGGKILFLQEDLEAFIAQGRQKADFELVAAANEWVNTRRKA